MQVTDDDLRRQCAQQHARYVACVQEHGLETAEASCQAQRLELERCATATVQMVKAVNTHCGELYARFESCVQRRRGSLVDCNAPAEAFYECAERFSPSPLKAGEG